MGLVEGFLDLVDEPFGGETRGEEIGATFDFSWT